MRGSGETHQAGDQAEAGSNQSAAPLGKRGEPRQAERGYRQRKCAQKLSEEAFVTQSVSGRNRALPSSRLSNTIPVHPGTHEDWPRAWPDCHRGRHVRRDRHSRDRACERCRHASGSRFPGWRRAALTREGPEQRVHSMSDWKASRLYWPHLADGPIIRSDSNCWENTRLISERNARNFKPAPAMRPRVGCAGGAARCLSPIRS